MRGLLSVYRDALSNKSYPQGIHLVLRWERSGRVRAGSPKRSIIYKMNGNL